MARSADLLSNFTRTVTTARTNLTGAALQQIEVKLARAELAQTLAAQQARSGTVPSYTTTVDGRRGAALESVKPGGKIVFTFDYLAEVADYTLAQLIALSPFRDKRAGAVPSTHYREAHRIFVNESEVDDLTTVKRGDEVAFVNMQPYSRKIDLISATTGKRLSAQAPDGVYSVVAGIVGRRYGNVAKVTYELRGFVGGNLLAQGRSHSRRLTKAKNRADNRFPTIIVTEI